MDEKKKIGLIIVAVALVSVSLLIVLFVIKPWKDVIVGSWGGVVIYNSETKEQSSASGVVALDLNTDGTGLLQIEDEDFELTWEYSETLKGARYYILSFDGSSEKMAYYTEEEEDFYGEILIFHGDYVIECKR